MDWKCKFIIYPTYLRINRSILFPMYFNPILVDIEECLQMQFQDLNLENQTIANYRTLQVEILIILLESLFRFHVQSSFFFLSHKEKSAILFHSKNMFMLIETLEMSFAILSLSLYIKLWYCSVLDVYILSTKY